MRPQDKKISSKLRIVVSLVSTFLMSGAITYLAITMIDVGGFRTYLPYVEPTTPVAMNDSSIVMNKDLVRISGPISMRSAETTKAQILEQYIRDPKKPIRILINSPGGSVFAGRTIIDVMDLVSNPVECHVEGYAASMAAMIFMHCDKRYMMPSAFLLFHQMSMAIPTHKQIREIQRDIEFWNAYWQELVVTTAHNMGMTYQELYDMMSNTWMLTAKQAKIKGFIDDFIADYKCDKRDDECVEPLYQWY